MSNRDSATLSALELKLGHIQERLDDSTKELAQARVQYDEFMSGLQDLVQELEKPRSRVAMSAALLQMQAARQELLGALVLEAQAAEQDILSQLQGLQDRHQALAREKLTYEKLMENLRERMARQLTRREQKQVDEMATHIFLRNQREAARTALAC